MLCPELVGRDAEVEHLARRLTGHAGVTVVVGSAGSGKSRLVHDALAPADVEVLAGRAVPAEVPAPYRPLTEAFLAVARGRERPSDPSLVGFEGQLGRLVPSWGGGEVADDSPVLLAEAVVRLLAVLSRDRPQVLLVEDLHWADPETLEVVEYLGDALRDGPAACLCTSRPGGSADAVVDRLQRRHPDSVVVLGPLDPPAVDRMVAACLATPDPPAQVCDLVAAHADGVPFLVEELLAGFVASGALVRDDRYWDVVGLLSPSVPASLRDSIDDRLHRLEPTTRRVLGAASLLGRIFEWELLPGIAEVDARTAVDALREAVDAQLVEVDGDGFRFRHALTREAVLGDLLPPERRELARRARPAFERAHPGLPGPTCQLAADLAEAAGDRDAAAARLVECADRALAGGALASAEATARRACELAGPGTPVELDARERLVQVLVAAGKPDAALSVGGALVAQLDAAGAPARRRADLLVALVRAAVATGELDAATAAADRAREAVAEDEDEALSARLDVVCAELALDRSELGRAEALARRAVAAARATDQPAVLCEGLLVLGRLLRLTSIDRSDAAFREAEAMAEAAGLVRWHLRARQELTVNTFHLGAGAVRATRDLAARYGAHLTVAVMDLMLADLALGNFDAEACEEASLACLDASRRFHLAAEPVAHLWLAGAHALRGDDPAMEVAVAAALRRDPDDHRILADLHGRVLATRAFVRDELDELPGIYEAMMGHVRLAPPAASIYPGRATWAVLRSITDADLGEAARAEVAELRSGAGLHLYGHALDVSEAVAVARRGDHAEAMARLTAAHQDMVDLHIGRGMNHAMWVLVAQACIAGGWGDASPWLRQASAWFADRRLDRLVRRCRSLLTEAGAPVPRRGRGDSEVPSGLAALGVTSREVDVLKLVVEGRTNREIAEALYLSPKTVERHVSSLFDRTGVRDRRALAVLGAGHLP